LLTLKSLPYGAVGRLPLHYTEYRGGIIPYFRGKIKENLTTDSFDRLRTGNTDLHGFFLAAESMPKGVASGS